MKISYDQIADVLYIAFSAPKNRAQYVEVKGGILRVDEDTQQVIGVTIPFFQEKTATTGKLNLPQIGALMFSPEIKHKTKATSSVRIKAAAGNRLLAK